MDIGGMIVPTAKSLQPVERARDLESLWFLDHRHIPANRETPPGGRPIGRDPASVMHRILVIGP